MMRALSAALPRGFLAFVVVGVVATSVQYAWLTVLVWGFGVPATPASACGYVASVVLNYALNRRLTFASERAHNEALPRFMLVSFSGLVLNSLLVWTMSAALHQHFLVAQLVATAAVLLWNYSLHRRWTFADAR